jgi:hypothetical protein
MPRKELDLNTLSFREFKEEFYSRIPDPRIFDCGEINLLKVVLDGLKVNYVAKGWKNTELFSGIKTSLKKAIRRIKYAGPSKISKEKIKSKMRGQQYLVYETGRIIKDGSGKVHSQFFSNILDDLGKDSSLVILENSARTELPHDLTHTDVVSAFANEIPSEEENKLKSQLISSYKHIEKTELFSETELLNIQTALTKFYNEFTAWNRFLSKYGFNIKWFLFTCHYHKEGLLYAFKKRGIPCIELQHGLISPEDIFYVFPESTRHVCPRALFSDKIIVFGEYWKNVLLQGVEFPESSISVAGYFPFNDFSSYESVIAGLKKQFTGKTVLLVTTQTFMHEYYIEYIRSLAIKTENRPYLILIKPHPSEKPEIYESAFRTFQHVQVFTLPTEVLFRVANLHLSVYSTTLFDCVKHHIPNFTLYIEQYGDYVRTISNNGIAALITPAENPFDKNFTPQPQIKNQLFAEYKNFFHSVKQQGRYEHC